MNKTKLVSGVTHLVATAALEEKVKEELEIPDPSLEQAESCLQNNIQPQTRTRGDKNV